MTTSKDAVTDAPIERGVSDRAVCPECAHEQVRALSAELDAIFRIIPDGIVSFDAAGHLSYANPAFVRLTGIEPERLSRLDEDGLERLLADLADPQTRDDDIARDRLHLLRPRRCVIQRSSRPITDVHDRPIGRLVHLRDVTHEDEVDRMKSEFLTAAAHELRSPLAAIHGFIELLLHREYPPERRRDMLATAHRHSTLMVKMIGELLDLSRIEARAGRDFRIRPQALAPIVREAIASFADDDGAPPVTFEAPDRPAVVHADAQKLGQAIANVLSNALKYSPDATPVRVRVVAREEDDRLGVQVRDSGIGMTPEQVRRVFDRFWRADPTGSIPGTGLGMSLVKEMVELMGGSVSIRSEPRRGTEVTLWLRAAHADEHDVYPSKGLAAGRAE